MLDQKQKKELELFSIDIRENILRQIAKRGFGHVGGSMSAADIISVLYGLDMNVDPSDPQKKGRDLLVCSKGHAGPAVYAALALRGFFPLDWLDTLNQPGTSLPSHCDMRKTPGIDMTTGSLGQGISSAAGMALACKTDGLDNHTFCILGDGEMQEGQVWEALLFAAHQKLDHLIVFIDSNKMQLDGSVEAVNGLGRLAERLDSFGYDTQEIDGHDVCAIHDAIEHARSSSGKPCAIIANTEKGHGCSFAVGVHNHHINVSPEQYEEAMRALESERRNLA